MSNQTSRPTNGRRGAKKSRIREKTVSGQLVETLKRFAANDRVNDDIDVMNQEYMGIVQELNRLSEVEVFQYSDILSRVQLPSIYAGLVQPCSVKVEPTRSYTHLGIPKHNASGFIGLQDAYDLVASSRELNEQGYVNFMRTRKGFSFVSVLDRLQPVTWESVEDRCAFFNPEAFDGNIFDVVLYEGDSQLKGNFDDTCEFIPVLVRDVLFGSIMTSESYPRGDGAIPIRRYFQTQDQVSIKGGMTSTTQDE